MSQSLPASPCAVVVVVDKKGAYVEDLGELIGDFQLSAKTLVVREPDTAENELTQYDLPKLKADLKAEGLSLRVISEKTALGKAVGAMKTNPALRPLAQRIANEAKVLDAG